MKDDCIMHTKDWIISCIAQAGPHNTHHHSLYWCRNTFFLDRWCPYLWCISLCCRRKAHWGPHNTTSLGIDATILRWACHTWAAYPACIYPCVRIIHTTLRNMLIHRVPPSIRRPMHALFICCCKLCNLAAFVWEGEKRICFHLQIFQTVLLVWKINIDVLLGGGCTDYKSSVSALNSLRIKYFQTRLSIKIISSPLPSC